MTGAFRVVQSVSVGCLALGAVLVAVRGGRDVVLSAAFAGLVLILVGGMVMLVDAFRPVRRPAPRTVDGATHLVTTRLFGVVVLLGGAGFTVMVAGELARVGWSGLDPRRSGLEALGFLLAPLVVVVGLALLVRPRRLELTPDHLVVRQLLLSRRIDWDDITDVEPVIALGEAVRIRRRSARPVPFPTTYLPLDALAVRTVLLRQRDEPDQRRYLGTDAELERLADLQRSSAR